MIILGIDPGTIKAGYGVINAQGSEIRPVACGVIRGGSNKRADYAKRLKRIHAGIMEVIEEYSPEYMVIETVFFHKNVDTAIKIGEGRGMAVLASAQAGLELLEYPPTVVKKAVTGRGDASKEQVGEMVKMILGLDEVPKPDDATDALACAIAGYHRLQAGTRIME